MVAHIILVTTQYPDPRQMGRYYDEVEATMARYGGAYQSLLRHQVTTLEGEWHPDKGVVILEFPNSEQALAWYRSPEYAPLRELRNKTGRFDVILVDGLGEGVPWITGQLDPWEIERIAELAVHEAQEAQAARETDGEVSGGKEAFE